MGIGWPGAKYLKGSQEPSLLISQEKEPFLLRKTSSESGFSALHCNTLQHNTIFYKKFTVVEDWSLAPMLDVWNDISGLSQELLKGKR